jgi:hypothetical protein
MCMPSTNNRSNRQRRQGNLVVRHLTRLDSPGVRLVAIRLTAIQSTARPSLGNVPEAYNTGDSIKFRWYCGTGVRGYLQHFQGDWGVMRRVGIWAGHRQGDGSSTAAAFGEIDANQDQGRSDEQVAGRMLAEKHYGEDDDHHRLKIAEDRDARGGHVAQ